MVSPRAIQATAGGCRLAIAECLGALSRVAGLRVPELCLSRVIDSIRTNFDHDNAEPSSELARGDDRGDSAAVDGAGEGGDDVVGELLGAAYATPLPGRGELRHGTGELARQPHRPACRQDGTRAERSQVLCPTSCHPHARALPLLSSQRAGSAWRRRAGAFST